MKPHPNPPKEKRPWPPPEWSSQSWSPEWEQRRRAFMRRFIAVFLFASAIIALLFIGVGVLIAQLFRQRPIGSVESLFLMACTGGIVLLGVIFIGGLMARRFGSPLARLMAAADAVAAGDLSVRVPVRGGGNMTRFIERFNRMA